ncbi:MAG: class I adenylate-forming enzyme family protein [Pseudomonadota bacterium]
MPIHGPSIEGVSPVSIPDLLSSGLQRKPDEIAVASTKNSWTWRQLDKASDRYAAHLYAKGIRKGDRVASLMPNRDALLLHYLGCLKGGFVAVPLNYRYTPPEIDYALSLAKAKILLAHVEREADLGAAAEVAKLPVGVIRYGAGEGDDSLEAMLIKEPPPAKLEAPTLADPAFIFFTSGSTGKPKGVTHSIETLGWILQARIHGLGLTADDVALSAASMSHMGASMTVLAMLAAGGKSLLARTFDPDEVIALARNHAPTVMLMLPAALYRVVSDKAFRHDDFRSLRYCVSGGDKVPAELENRFAEVVGIPISEGYGMSELGVANLNPSYGDTKPGSIGPPALGFVESIRDDDGNEVGPGVEGRLWVQSPSITPGYWGNPEATADLIIDGWLDTGDVMRADEDGYLHFCGRKKQIIVHDSSNISPQEVEEALIEHPAISGAGVVGVHDLVHGENVWAYVTLAQGEDPPSEQQLIAFARERVGYKAPELIEFLPDMPMNAAGKTDRVTLKKWAAERHNAEIAA